MDATEPAPDAPSQPQVVFRGKKRKGTYRQRADPVQEASQNAQSSAVQDAAAPEAPPLPPVDAPQQHSKDTESAEETELSVAELLRRRNARKARLGGVTFGGEASSSRTDEDAAAGDELSLMIREEENKIIDAAAAAHRRFVHQTGLTKEVTNKHMTEFIEAELAKRYSSLPAGTAATAAGPSAGSSADDDKLDALASVQLPQNAAKRDKHTAFQGKILEIDLGDEVRARNKALTDSARRRLEGEAVEDDEQAAAPSKKVRLGPDGKPWRPRNRRGSDAIARDQLVEELMRENKVDNFEKPAAADESSGLNEEDELMAADDRIAEEFRREFMEAMSQRRQARKRTMPINAVKQAPKRREGEVLKGPKLGGSRNARAAMREILLQQQEAAKRESR